MSHKLKKPSPEISFPKLEKDVLAFWKKDRTFERSLEQTKQGKRFTFYDGPPFATGLPHYGHLLQATIKDIVPRFKTMQGRFVERRFGWDCHGLPVEYELEKELGIKTRQEILEMGVDKFNDACRGIVLRHAKDFEEATGRIGRWIDFENDYKTMDQDYMESVWWILKTLWDKDLLYEGRKSMHICPRCATPLSNFEVAQGYQDRQDPSVFVAFPLADDPEVSLVAWTTTPWTLPGNVLLALNPNVTYVEVTHRDKRFVVARSRVDAVFGQSGYETKRTWKASELSGKRYEPPFPVANLKGKHYEVVTSGVVSDEEGTGVLHVAPAFGEDDMALGEKEKAAFIQHITINGQLTDPFPRHHDKTALEANQPLIAELKKSGRLLRKETITHAYPHCWRCDTPLLNYALTTWFVAVTKLKEKLQSENKQIGWTPAHIRDGRFGKWLEGARDWAISRNRFWGNPVPIWRCGKDHLRVVGSLDELEELSGERPADLHKQFVDKITFPCPDCKGEMRRIEDVLDCWFESGSMPYGSQHYPFEHEKEFAQKFPADFIAEGLDQTRGWFYTLHVLGVAVKDSRAYENVVTTGLVLAEDGKKMSKSLQNFPDPKKIFGEYGADALRLYLMLSPIVRGDDLRFSEKDVAEVTRNFNLTLWNTYSFLTTYAAVDGWEPVPVSGKSAHVLDRWILSRLQTLTSEVTDALNQFDLMRAARSLLAFLDECSNWYVRRSRRRFWKSEDDADKRAAYATLYEVLTTFCRLAAPFTPFISEKLYRDLTGEDSVHLTTWPKPSLKRQDVALEKQMSAARRIVSLGLAARSGASIKLRQPLSEVRVVERVSHGIRANAEIVDIIRDELNVKAVRFTKPGDQFVREVAHPEPTVIGPALGKDAQRVIAAIKKGEYERKGKKVVVGPYQLPEDAVRLTYEPAEQFSVESDSDFVVGLETSLTDELRGEGTAREVVRAFQELRKASGLAVEDRIVATYQTDDSSLRNAIGAHQDLIASEILARSLESAEPAGKNKDSLTIDGRAVVIGIRKA